MALSDTDLHWIPMNRSKFNQIRRMFDVKPSEEQGSRTLPRMPCDKCTSPRIRYTSAESVSALAQIRALLRPVDPDSCSTSSRSRSTSEDSVELRTRGHHQLPANGLVVIDPLLCSKNLTQINDNSNTTDNDTADKTRNERSVCETVAEVTENVTVSDLTDRESTDNTNSNVNHIDHSSSNGDIPSAEKQALLENGEIRNGHHQNGEINENDKRVVVGETVGKPTIDNEISSSSEQLDNDKDHDNSHPENGSSSCDDSLDEEVANNNIFLNMVNDMADILTSEREYFLSLLDEASAVSEEAGGRVMASCGKANLLLTSKFKQYRGLCYEYQKTSRKMTADDMQGFWELILLQVEDVKKMFAALRSLKENDWIIPKSPMPKKKGAGTPRTPATNKKKPREKSAAQKARDDERRKMLMAKKLEMKQMLQQNGGEVPDVIIT